jgi:hypothetical protein
VNPATPNATIAAATTERFPQVFSFNDTQNLLLLGAITDPMHRGSSYAAAICHQFSLMNRTSVLVV